MWSIVAIVEEMYSVKYTSIATIRPIVTAVGPFFWKKMSIVAIDKEVYCVEYRSVATIRPTVTAVGTFFWNKCR